MFEALKEAAKDGRSETAGRIIGNEIIGAEALARDLLSKLTTIESA